MRYRELLTENDAQAFMLQKDRIEDLIRAFPGSGPLPKEILDAFDEMRAIGSRGAEQNAWVKSYFQKLRDLMDAANAADPRIDRQQARYTPPNENIRTRWQEQAFQKSMERLRNAVSEFWDEQTQRRYDGFGTIDVTSDWQLERIQRAEERMRMAYDRLVSDVKAFSDPVTRGEALELAMDLIHGYNDIIRSAFVDE